MKEIYLSDFIKVEFENANQILKNTWIEKTEPISSEEMHKVITSMAQQIRLMKPKKVFANDINRNYVYDVDEQAWVAQTLVAASLEVGVTKFGILPPEDLLGELSTEQTADEAGDIPVEIRIFKDADELYAWLCE